MLTPVSVLLVTILSSVMSVAMPVSLQFAAIPGIRRWIVAGVLWVVSMVLIALQGFRPAVAQLSMVGHAIRGTVYFMEWTRQTERLPRMPVNLIFLASGILLMNTGKQDALARVEPLRQSIARQGQIDPDCPFSTWMNIAAQVQFGD